MGKRQEAALETKRKITSAVNELLSQKSLDEISIEEITTTAGVAKGSFYTYFKRKEDAVCCNALEKYDCVKKESLETTNDLYVNLCTYLKGSAKIIDRYSLKTAQGWMKSVTSPLDGEKRGIEKYAFDNDNIRQMLQNAVSRKEISENAPINEITEIIMNSYYGAVATWCITLGKVELTSSIKLFCEHALKAIIEQYKEENSCKR